MPRGYALNAAVAVVPAGAVVKGKVLQFFTLQAN
jgi:hypothetical protein